MESELEGKWRREETQGGEGCGGRKEGEGCGAVRRGGECRATSNQVSTPHRSIRYYK